MVDIYGATKPTEFTVIDGSKAEIIFFKTEGDSEKRVDIGTQQFTITYPRRVQIQPDFGNPSKRILILGYPDIGTFNFVSAGAKPSDVKGFITSYSDICNLEKKAIDIIFKVPVSCSGTTLSLVTLNNVFLAQFSLSASVDAPLVTINAAMNFFSLEA